MMISGWKSLFGINLGGHCSTYLSVRPFGGENLEKYIKRCPHTFLTQLSNK